MRIERLLTCIPAGRIDAHDIILDAGGDRRQAESFVGLFGMERVARDDSALGLVDRLHQFLDALGPVDDALRPDSFIYVHAQPVADKDRLPDRRDLRHGHPWLRDIRHVQEMDQYNCAGIFFALSMVGRLLECGLASNVLIFAGDSFADWEPRHRYVPGCTVLGDAFAAILLSARPGGMQLDRIAADYHSGFSGGLDAGEDEMRQFHSRHIDLICETLAQGGSAGEEAGYILPHNINSLAWRLFARRQNIPVHKVRLDLVREIGHCCTTDPFLLLDKVLSEHDAGAALDAHLMSVGMGGFTGAARVTMA